MTLNELLWYYLRIQINHKVTVSANGKQYEADIYREGNLIRIDLLPLK